MNRTDRLLAIVLELQAKGKIRAEDLAATFETSKRTIYRDIQALCESGVPVIAVPGQGYSLVEGFFLPPVSFTTDEATMLLLGTNFMAANFDKQYQAAAISAGRKIEAVLHQKRRDEVHYLQDNITFVPPAQFNPETLFAVRQAILEHKTLRFIYHTRYPNAATPPPAPREADPYSLVHFNEAWYLSAYCHIHNARRNFRLDRMEAITMLQKSFTRLPDFTHNNTGAEDGRRTLIIRALFTPAVTRWVREARYYFVTQLEDTPNGLLATLTVRQDSEALQWLLGWGAAVTVLEPESLRQQIQQQAQQILKLYPAH
jgi:predicted DNA-binding transcriptional regulator YafY